MIQYLHEGLPDNLAEIADALLVVIAAIVGIFKAHKAGKKAGKTEVENEKR